MKKISLTFAVLFLVFGIVSVIGGNYFGVSQRQVIGMVVFNVVVSLLWIGIAISSPDKNRTI